MELDILVDSAVNGGGCCLALMGTFVACVGTASGKKMLLICKCIGILLDIIYVMSYINWSTFELNFSGIDDETSFIIYSVFFLAVDRIGAIIMILIYGRKPTEQYKYYAKQMHEKNKKLSYESMLALYYGAQFSFLDFCGQIHKSYAHIDNKNIPQSVKVAVQIQIDANNPQTSQTTQNVMHLPVGWRAAYTKNSQRYYINDIEKRTQWKHPAIAETSTTTQQKEEKITSPPTYKSWGFATFYFVLTFYYTIITCLVVIYSTLSPLSFTKMQATLMFLSLQFQIVAVQQHWINFSTGVDKLCCCQSCKGDLKNDKVGGCTCAVNCGLIFWLFLMEGGLLWFWMSAMLGYEA